MAPGSAVKQSSLLGFFSKSPAQKHAPHVATPPPSSQPTQASPSPSPHARDATPTSLTPPPSSDAPDEPVTDGRRRAASRRVSYYEERSEDSKSSDDEHAEKDAFVASDASSSDEDAVSAVASEDDATSEPEPATPPPRAAKRKELLAPPTLPRSQSHLTKAELRAQGEKRRRIENEEAYSFLLDVRDKEGHRPGELDYDKRTLYIPPAVWQTFTPFEKQFWELKQHHFDTVLFFQKGKFYELYEDDAMIGHRELDLKLTDRVKMKMVGVPEASFDMFATKLLALGYKVGRVDQMETAVAKGMRVGEKSRGGGSEIVRRELRHVVTGGTIVDGAALDDLSSYCVCIKEHRHSQDAPPTFGIATLDAATAEFRLVSFEDDMVLTQLETLLRSLRIREVLHEKGIISPATLRLIRNLIPSTCQITMLRPHTEFLDADAAQLRLQTLFHADTPESLPAALQPLLGERLSMSALGGMLWYLEQLNLDVDLCASANFARLAPPGKNGVLVLDAKSLMHLNVLHNDEGTDTGTLHRLLNRCITPYGRRLFTLWLAAPLTDIDAINARLDAVDDALRVPQFEEAFAALVRGMPDLARLQTRIVAGKSRPRDFLSVLHAYAKFSPARAQLLEIASEFSKGIRARLEEMPDVSALAAALRANFHAKDDGSFTPRPSKFPAFDVAEEGVREAEAALEKERAACVEALSIPSSHVAWKHIGTNEIYQIEVPAKTRVPADWIVMSQTKANKRYYTPHGRDLVRHLKEARERRLAAVRAFQDDIYVLYRADYPMFARAVHLVAEIDCLLSLAKSAAALGPAVRPTLLDKDTAAFCFTALRHPCIRPSIVSGSATFIPNDIALGGDKEEVMILTGGNMAGKSTTARTAATAVILAQIGCYVPAEHASLVPVDRIASRMGANDQLFCNNSTFMVEMLEAAKIMREATPKSLVIIDELGRGTSTFDGQAIAYAVLHHIIARTRCLCFFMTHYSSMAATLDAYPRVSNKHMQVLVDDAARDVVFTYQLVEGIAASSYGTQVARIAGVPSEICTKAARISQDFFHTAAQAHARRAHSRIPLERLTDFAFLVRLHAQSAPPEILAAQLRILFAAARTCVGKV